MGKFAACALVLVASAGGAACQSMYGAKSEHLPRIAKIPHKVVPEPVPLTPYVDSCATNFRGGSSSLIPASGSAGTRIRSL